MNNIDKIINDVRNLLEYYRLMGVKEIPAAKKREANKQRSQEAEKPEVRSQKSEARGQRSEVISRKPEVRSQKPASSEEKLKKLREEIGECRLCRLHKGRTHLVFGAGNPNAKLMFIGEGPGRDEDLKGEPFVGRAGQLLTKIIQAMGFKRSDVYIANIVKCRPPENRNPEPDEIETCAPFLLKQIEIIKPKAIICLGKFAAQTMLETLEPITRLRGKMGEFKGIPVMPTYHPAYLLRNPGAKKIVWEDVKRVMKILKE
jgi:DNA polymerase